MDPAIPVAAAKVESYDSITIVIFVCLHLWVDAPMYTQILVSIETQRDRYFLRGSSNWISNADAVLGVNSTPTNH